MTIQTPGTLFHEGRLADAIAACEAQVRTAPADVPARLLLAEMLLFTGHLERSDAVLVAVDAVDPGLAVVIAEFRQLLRAAAARRQTFAEGRVPEFLGSPTPSQSHLLAALVALRAGDDAAAQSAVQAAETARPVARGSADGAEFADFRDADDLLGGTLEVLTTTGKYYWVSIDRVLSMELHAPKRTRDLFWRRCSMTVRDGPDGDVYIPVLYEPARPLGADEDALRLGRRTEWSDTAPVRGCGQRLFLMGEDGVGVHQLGEIVFA